ncbi:MAG TPA: SRPBCC family protein [Chloroflexota bacterium]|nr:SRPBCC family protein [Chloroflexota bacterium]
MRQVRIRVERLIDAPADVVYQCLADYHHHHRPGGFLPPAFHDQHVIRGGVGAGTVIRFSITLAGRTRTVTTDITEPEPGRVLLETQSDGQLRTLFTVEPVGRQCRVSFDTLMTAHGLEGIMLHLFARRLLLPLYKDEQARLEQYARAQVPVAA